MTYERTLQDIGEENWEYAYRLFQCIAVASRPLRVEELAEFLAIDFGGGTPALVTNWRPDNPSNAVLTTCSSLIAVVTVDGPPVVQFSHFSVQEYLMSSRFSSGLLSRYYISLEPAHTIVAQACLSVLLQLDNHSNKRTIEEYPLARYSAQHWSDHAKFQNVSLRVERAMKHLFDRDRPHFAAWVRVYDMDRESRRSLDSETPLQPDAPPIYYATLLDFPDVAEWLVNERSQYVNELGGYYGTPLCAAAARGCLKVAQVLLKRGAYVDAARRNGWSPLLWASDRGCLELSQLMVDHGADINFRDSLNRTSLSLASGKGHLEIARLLLQQGADVNIWQRGEGTVLIRALQREDLAFAELLLTYHADVNAQNGNGLNLLRLASGQRDLVAVRWLLERGATFQVRNNQPGSDRRTTGSLLSFIYSQCLSSCLHCIINPKGRIRLPDDDEGEPQDTTGIQVGSRVKRRALLVSISYAHSQSDTWWPLENPHEDVDLFWNLLVSE
jgi:hypothetical protein